jgi:hypothetical protein
LVLLIKNKYVSQPIFIDLLYKVLKIKAIFFNNSFVNEVNISLGLVVSPILTNIYLNELDLFINQGKLMDKYRGRKPARSNNKFVSFIKSLAPKLKKVDNIKKMKGKLKY